MKKDDALSPEKTAPVSRQTTELCLATDNTRPRLRSDELFARGHEVIIEHGREEYRLRLTSQNKLILTK